MRVQILDVVVEGATPKGAATQYCATIFGSNPSGESVALRLKGFHAMVHVRVPNNGPSPADLKAHLVRRCDDDRMSVWVRAVRRANLVNFRGSWVRKKYGIARHRYIEVRFNHPRVLQILRSLFPTTPKGRRRASSKEDLRRMTRRIGYDRPTPSPEHFTLHGDERTLRVQVLLMLGTDMLGWVEVPDARLSAGPDRTHVARWCGSVGRRDVRALPAMDDSAPFTVAAFDIETHSRRRGGPKGRRGFSRAHVPGDHVISVALAFAPYGGLNKPRKTVCLFLGPVEHPDAVPCATESELLTRTRDAVVAADASWIVGYNSDKFDWKVLAARATLVNYFARTRGSPAVRRNWEASRDAVRRYGELDARYARAAKAGTRCRSKKGPTAAPACACCECVAAQMCAVLGLRRSRRRPAVPQLTRLLACYGTVDELREAEAYFGAQPPTTFFKLHRFAGRDAALERIILSTSANGHNVMDRILMHGRVTQDLFLYMKQTFKKFTSYKLKSVCKELLGADGQKNDLPYQEMFEAWEALEHVDAGSDPGGAARAAAIARRREIVEYNVQDAVVVLLLLHRASVCVAMVEQARVCHVTPQDIATRGQQIRVYSQLYWLCARADIVLNRYQMQKPDSYEGATVLPPTPGYYEDFVATLDFASLYPSIIMAKNFCFSTFVAVHDLADPKVPHAVVRYRRNKAAPRLVEVELRAGGAATHRLYFVPPAVHRGVLPRLVDNLLRARKKVKAAMKAEKDPQRKRILDERQKGLKISANSAYGFTGVERGYIAFWVVAAAITASGRQMIDDTRRAVEAFPLGGGVRASVIYGDTDSVMVLLRGLPRSEAGLRGAFDHAEVLARHVTDVVFRAYPAIVLEAEDVAWGFQIWEMKKRYIKRIFESRDQALPVIVTKGVESARRDQPPVLLKVYKAVAKAMFPCARTPPLTRAELLAVAYPILRRVLEDVANDRLPLASYTVSRELAGSYKFPGRIVSWCVAEKRRKRVEAGLDPRPPPFAGERMTTVQVVVREPKKGMTNAQKAEDPWFVARNPDTLLVDLSHYLEKMYEPLKKLLWYSDRGAPVLKIMIDEAVAFRESRIGHLRVGATAMFVCADRTFESTPLAVLLGRARQAAPKPPPRLITDLLLPAKRPAAARGATTKTKAKKKKRRAKGPTIRQLSILDFL